MTHTPELLPCPFCGGPAEHDSGHYVGLITPSGLLICGHAIYCADTGCVGCPIHSVVWTEEDGGFEAAAEAWNTRAGIPDPAQLRADRDALLEALVEARDVMAGLNDDEINLEFLPGVSALIARIRGEG